jgi:fibronectin-binding autotransporter adhesin
MATWKKVIVSGSQAHLQGITASNLTNNTAVPTAQIVGYNPTTGVLSYFNTSSIVNPNAFVQGGNSFGTTALLGTNDNQNLQFETNGSVAMTINTAGQIGIGTTNPSLGILQIGATGTNPHANIVVSSGNTGTSSITVRAINGFAGHERTYNPVGGSDSLNFIQLLDADTTSAANQTLGKIIFSSLDTDTTGSGTTKAFIEAVSEDATPDAFLAFGTNQSGSLVTERMRITSVGNVGIGITTPTNTLQVGGTGISTTNLTASALPTLAQVQVLGIDASGNITKFSTSSIALPTTIDGVGVGQRLTMWSDNNTITTSSIVMTTEANPRFIVGYTDTGTSPVFAGRLNVSGSGGNEGIVVGSRVSTDVNSYGTYVFSDTEGPKIGFGSYTTGVTTTPLSASWAQIGVYNQALRFEAFTTGSHQLTGGILFSYSGSNRPDLKISASNGATLVGINTATPTNTLQVGGGITAVNITASGNISSSAGLIGQTLTTSGGATVGGTLAANGGDITSTNTTVNLLNGTTSTVNFGGAASINMGASNGTVTVAGNLSVNGNTTLGNAALDTASINAGRVNISNLTAGSSELAVLVTGSGGQVFTRQLAASAFGGGGGVSGTLIATRVPFADGTNSLTSSANMTFVTDTLTVNGSTFGQSVSVNQNLTVGGNATITGDLTVNGETTIINTTNLSIEDKFIVLGRSSGSQVPASEGGIIVEGAGGSGSAFVFNSGSGGTNGLANRWGVALGVPTGSMNVTPTDFMVTVSSSGVSPTDSNAPTFGSSSFGYGNMHINTTDGEIWIYV